MKDERIIKILQSKYHEMNRVSNIEEFYDEMVKDILNNQILIDLPKSSFSYFGVLQFRFRYWFYKSIESW